MKKPLFLTLLLLFSISCFSYNGKVFYDDNKNGIYDKKDQLLPGVMVSDGLHVVKTDSNGEFNLPGHDRARFITVTTPTGYMPSKVHYIKIDKNLTSYNFPLLKTNKVASDGKHSFIHISDTEIRDANPIHKIWANNIRDYAQNENIGFIMHTGDICYEGGLKAHIHLMNSQNMGVPMYYGIGNHDLVEGAYGEELFESIYGPVWYSFDYGNIHYVMTPMAAGDFKPSYNEAYLYEWLKNDLSHIPKDQPIIIFNHNLKSTDKFIIQKNEKEKLVLNKDYNLKAWISGHCHISYVTMQGDVKTISTAPADKGGKDHSIATFRECKVDSDGNLETQLRYTFVDNNIHLSSISNDKIAVNAAGDIALNVNTYISQSPTKRVTYSIYNQFDKVVSQQDLKQKTDWAWMGTYSLPKRFHNQQLFVEATAEYNNGTIAKVVESFTYKDHPQKVEVTNDWTNLVGNSSHTSSVTNEFKLPLQIRWVNNIEANISFSSPLIYGDKVYVAATDDDLRGEGGIYALDIYSGELLWKYNTRNSIKNTIAIESGRVFAQDADGYLYAVNSTTGKLEWEKKLDAPIYPILSEGLAAYGGVIYAGVGESLCAIESNTGKEIWQNKDKWKVTRQSGTSSISVNESILIMGAQWDALYGHDTQTGELKWSLNQDGTRFRSSSPALYGNLAYFISSKTFFIVNALSGKVITKKELDYSVDVASTPLVTDKFIVFGTANNGLVALDRETLKEKWVVNTLPSLIYTVPYQTFPINTVDTSPVLIGDLVVFGASDGILYGVDINTGTLQWRHTTGAPSFSSMAVSGNVLIATDFSGNVYAFTSKEVK